jgi:hypothetical protein
VDVRFLAAGMAIVAGEPRFAIEAIALLGVAIFAFGTGPGARLHCPR